MLNKTKIRLFEGLRKNYRYYLGLVLVYIFFLYTSYYTRDPDYGWHLRAGEFFARFGIPKTDIFTFTAAGFPWINHEWLNDVMVYYLNTLGAKIALALVFSALWCLALYLASRKKSLFVLLLSSIAILPFSGVRPVAWTVLFVATLERLNEPKNRKFLYIIPLVFIAWANLHGGFVFGLVLITIWQFSKKTRISWLIYAISVAAVFFNPYFWKIFIEIGSTLFDAQLKFRIAEWVPLKLPWLAVIYMSAFLVVFLSVNNKWIRKAFSIPGLTLVMALSSIRHTPLFVITSLRYFEESLEKLIKKLSGVRISKALEAFGLCCLSTFMIVAGLLTAFSIKASRQSDSTYPVKAVGYLNKTDVCSRNIFNDYNFGGYLIDELPSHKFYIDGRMPSWKSGPTNYFENYQRFRTDERYRNEEINKYAITCMIILPEVELERSLQKSGWLLVREGSDNNYRLYIKETR